ncbi:uncharacterized protein LOC101859703 [Aplysia californica]|uniref:Uncharacterized protein LOC101859703 n=1 Tax=Aplysia californica TaxID=6500 RepID=A0ABM0JNG9_APLCA|nr:uncharacterized protein LOC101859703 [Aplysia californica]
MPFVDHLTDYLVVRLRLIFYIVLVFFSIVTIAGIASMKDKRGLCPLYLDGGRYFTLDYSPPCNFPLCEAVFQLLYCVFRVVVLTLLLSGRASSDHSLYGLKAQSGFVAYELVTAFIIFICACILSAGTNDTCSNMWWECDKDWYSSAQAAQAGAWLSTFLFLASGGVGLLYLYRCGRLPCFKQPPVAGPPANNVSGSVPAYAPESGVDSFGVSGPPPSYPASPPSNQAPPPSYPDPPPSYSAQPPSDLPPPSYPGTMDSKY